jgi:hypothetical protein
MAGFSSGGAVAYDAVLWGGKREMKIKGNA